MAYVIIKKIDLASFDGWEGCYISFKSPTYNEIKKFKNIDVKADDDEAVFMEMVAFMSGLFVEGKGFNGSEATNINKEELAELPIEIINYIIQEFTGAISLKAKES